MNYTDLGNGTWTYELNEDVILEIIEMKSLHPRGTHTQRSLTS